MCFIMSRPLNSSAASAHLAPATAETLSSRRPDRRPLYWTQGVRTH